jgi:hypothetical protein
MPVRVTDKLLYKLHRAAAAHGHTVTVTLPDGTSIRIEPADAIVPPPGGNTCDEAFGVSK